MSQLNSQAALLPWILLGRACMPRGMCSLWAAWASAAEPGAEQLWGGGEVCAAEAGSGGQGS